MESHTQVIQEVKYNCDQCERKYAEQKSLKIHINIVHGGHQYKCDRCKCTFKTRLYLTEHRKSCNEHLVVYNCDICPYTSTWIGHLKLHKKGKHENMSIYRFDLCTYKTTKKTELLKHIRSKHKDPPIKKEKLKIECSQCRKEFKITNQLNEHKRVIHDGILLIVRNVQLHQPQKIN